MDQVISVFAPIFSITLLGYVCGRLKLLGDTGPKVLSRFVFFVAMPPLIFITLATRKPEEIAHWNYMLSYFTAITAAALIFLAINRFWFREKGAELSLGIFTSVNGNAGYLGIPICMYAFGSPLPAILVTVIHMVYVYPVLLTWIELDLAKRNGAPISSKLGKLARVFTVVFKNPVLLATFLGVAVVATGLELPAWTVRTCHLLGDGAIPAAVFALGVTLSEKGTETAGAELSQIAFSSVVKMVLMPILAYGFGHYVFGLSGTWLAMLVFVAALPSPKNAFILAQSYGIYVRRAAMTVMLTTVASAITLPLVLYAFDGLSAP